MTSTSPYPQTWDLDSLADHPSTDSFRQLMDEYRSDLMSLADKADNLPPLGELEPEILSDWETFLDCLLYTSPSPRDRG